MEIALIIIAFLCLAVGIAGSVLPGLPGPPICWVGLLIASFTAAGHCSVWLLVATGAIAAIITVMDYVLPSTYTKKFGGSKAGIWGCNIGLVVSILGLPFGPQGLLGIVFWPFVGALVGEYIQKKELDTAMKAAWGAFVGFLSGTLLKLAYCVALLIVEIGIII